MQGTRFMLSYITSPIGSTLPLVGSLAMRAQGGNYIKDEEYLSKHIAELKDAFDQIKDLLEKEANDIDNMIEEDEGS